MTDQQRTVREAIVSGAELTQSYLIMNGLATVVACYGLLANSTAVVIGAMIIAMLLGPIMGLALAMVDGDTSLLKRSAMAEFVGAVLVLALGMLIGKLHGAIPISEEILSRTKPNFLDLAIAVFGGAAGAYATVAPKVSVGLVGVAISTALVPPLAVCGICLARGLPELAGGAFILFVTNLVAIQCASSVVLFFYGFHELTNRQSGDKSYIRRLAFDGVLFLSLTVFLYFQLSNTIRRQGFEELVKSRLEHGLKSIRGAYLAETRFRTLDNAEVVVAVVRVPNSITPAQTLELEKLLPTLSSQKTVLHVRSLLTKETTSSGYLQEIEPTAPPIEDRTVNLPDGNSPVPNAVDKLPTDSNGANQPQ